VPAAEDETGTRCFVIWALPRQTRIQRTACMPFPYSRGQSLRTSGTETLPPVPCSEEDATASREEHLVPYYSSLLERAHLAVNEKQVDADFMVGGCTWASVVDTPFMPAFSPPMSYRLQAGVLPLLAPEVPMNFWT
jgi:hypothetical protein